MGKIFDMENPLMRGLSRLCDLMVINILALICCIPIITAGASISAMLYVELKWVRGEEGYTIRPFFKQFKDNLKQATAEWLVMLLMIAVFYADYYLFTNMPDTFPDVLKIIVLALAVFCVMISVWVFPLQCHFVNPVKATFRNAMLLAIGKLPRTVLMVIVWAAGQLLLYLSLTTSELFTFFPVIFLFFLSAPGYAVAKLVDKPFRVYEPEEEELSEEASDLEKEEAYRVLREEMAVSHSYDLEDEAAREEIPDETFRTASGETPEETLCTGRGEVSEETAEENT